MPKPPKRPRDPNQLGKMSVDPGAKMQDQPMSFAFALLPAEIAQITTITVVGPYQPFHRMLLDRIATSDVVTFDCVELGELLWHVSGGESEFQIRMRRAFIRSMYTLLAAPIGDPHLMR